jgi:hypothetical protein
MGVTMIWEEYGCLLVVASIIVADKTQTVPTTQ